MKIEDWAMFGKIAKHINVLCLEARGDYWLYEEDTGDFSFMKEPDYWDHNVDICIRTFSSEEMMKLVENQIALSEFEEKLKQETDNV